MDSREDRAARLKDRQQKRVERKLKSRPIKPIGDGFFEVQSGRGGCHVVALTPDRQSCSDCPQFDTGSGSCDHIEMVLIFIRDGQPAELMPEPRTHRQQTPRNWSFYKACRRLLPGIIEMTLRDVVVAELDGTRLQTGHVGRPGLTHRDVIMCANARRMHRASGLEVDRLVHEYHAAGWLLHPDPPCEDAIAGALRRPEILDTYTRLIGLAAAPLAENETVWAIDAQSWRTPCSLFEVYVTDAATKQKRWRKSNIIRLQVVLGTTWKIVGAVAILTEEDGEVPQTISLVQTVIDQFGQPELLLCDTAYSAETERQWLRDQGIVTRIPFRSNAKPRGNGSAWDFDLQDFLDADEHWWADYFGRPVVESYFGALMRTNGHVKKLKSKHLVSQASELLSLLLNYQLRMLLLAYLHGKVEIPWLSDQVRDQMALLRRAYEGSGATKAPHEVDMRSNVLLFPSRKLESVQE